jgi:hypothetical protein
MKETKYFVLLQTSVVLTEEYNLMVNSEKLMGITECLTLQMAVAYTNVITTRFGCIS